MVFMAWLPLHDVVRLEWESQIMKIGRSGQLSMGHARVVCSCRTGIM